MLAKRIINYNSNAPWYKTPIRASGEYFETLTESKPLIQNKSQQPYKGEIRFASARTPVDVVVVSLSYAPFVLGASLASAPTDVSLGLASPWPRLP